MNATTAFDTLEDQEDPFAALGKGRYVKKNYLRDNKIAFNITEIEGPSTGKFGEELILTIEYVDYETGDPTQGKLAFPYENKKGVAGPRTMALLSVQKGLALGRRYDGYYLTGSGTGYLLSKTI
jgi:hypothetical protein